MSKEGYMLCYDDPLGITELKMFSSIELHVFSVIEMLMGPWEKLQCFRLWKMHCSFSPLLS